MKARVYALLVAASFLLILLLIWRAGAVYYESLFLDRERKLISEIAEAIKTALFEAAARRLYVLDSISTFIQTAGDDVLESGFAPFAESLMQSVPGTLMLVVVPEGKTPNMAYSPNAAVSKNEVFKTQIESYLKDSISNLQGKKNDFLSGPHKVNGDRSVFIACRAEYMDDEFWGVSAIVLETNRLLESAGIERLSGNLKYAVQNQNGLILFGDDTAFDHDPVTIEISIGDNNWLLAAAPAGDWGALSDTEFRVYKIGTLSIVFALAILAYLLTDRHRRLEYSVRLRTEELRYVNDELEREMAERIAAESATAGALERLESVLDSMPLGCVINSLEYKIAYWNKAAELILGFQQSEVLGKDPFGLIIPDSAREYVIGILSQIVVGAEVYYGQNENITKDGRVIVCEWMNTPIKDDFGNLQGILSMFRDVTDDLKAESELAASRRKLSESEERFRLLAESARDIIYKFRLKPVPAFEYISPSCLEMTGYTQEEHYADPYLGRKIIHPDDIHLLDDEMQKPGGMSDVLVLRWIKKDGSVVWTEQSNSAVYDEGGELVAIHGIARDVTDRIKSETEMRRVHELLEKVLSNLDESVLILEPESRIIVDANSTTEKMFGYERDELLGKSAKMLHVDAQAFDLFGNIAYRPLYEAGNFSCEFSMKRKGGEIFPTEHFVTFIKDERGKPSKIISFVRDISARKRADEERDKLEKQLIQAQKLEAIGQLAGGVAHDFNNILTGILGYCELVDDSLPAGSPIKADIGEIREAANRAANLTSRLLTFSRQQVVQLSDVNLNQLAGGAVAFLRRVIGEYIELRFVPSDIAGIISCDPALMDQMLLNLAVNARDAMPDGGKLTISTNHITVTAAMEDSGAWPSAGEYEVIEVSDTGHGMPQEVIGRIYEPFFTTKEVGKGTGLGLAMVYGIVSQHQGLITVDSAIGKGTTFKIFIPSSDGLHRADDVAVSDEVRGGLETVLLAEDEDGLRKLARRSLERAGYSVLTASNGEEALALFEAWKDEISIIVMDIVMPKMSGIDAYGRMTKFAGNIKVLFTSGYTADRIPKAGIDSEYISFIPKPYSVATLLKAVRELLDAK